MMHSGGFSQISLTKKISDKNFEFVSHSFAETLETIE